MSYANTFNCGLCGAQYVLETNLNDHMAAMHSVHPLTAMVNGMKQSGATMTSAFQKMQVAITDDQNLNDTARLVSIRELL